MRRFALFYVLVIFLLASLIGGSVFSTYEFFLAEGPLPSRKEVLIEKGMPLRKIALYLQKEGVIDSPSIFALGVRANNKGNALQAGEYSIPARASAKMVMDILTGGQTYIRRISIPEGLTSYQVVELLKKTDTLVGDVEKIPENGTLLPETYYYSYGDTRDSILVRMENAMKRTLDELWPERLEGLPLKTPEEAVILASIVEKESSLDSERPHIASVFFNRLDKNMRLQSDPTVIFALTNGTGILKRKLWSNDLKIKDPYNTYVVYGLPKGPISNPGRDALEAVLNPLETNDLYFVADGTGGHVFSSSYEEHLQKVKEWRLIKDNKQARAKKKAERKRAESPVPPSLPMSYEQETFLIEQISTDTDANPDADAKQAGTN